MGITLGNTISLEEVTLMMGHMAQQDRAHETKSLGGKLEEETETKEEAREAVTKKQAELRELKQQARREHADDDSGFDFKDLPLIDDDWSKTEKKAAKEAIALEKTQVGITDSQGRLETLRNDAKDVNESYDSSRKLYESVQQELEASRVAPLL